MCGRKFDCKRVVCRLGSYSFRLFGGSVRVSLRIRFGTKCLGAGFPVHKNVKFLTMPTNILTSPWWAKTSAAVEQPSSCCKEEREREEKVCRSVIVESGMRLRKMKNGYVKKNQSALSILVLIVKTPWP